ncbi:hypothetical protein ES332_D06G141500v1, partial [Gossypium tomentosum]
MRCCLEDAQELFDKMPEKGCLPNEFSFGILVRGYCRVGLANKGLELLDEIEVLGFCLTISSLCEEGKLDGLFPDVVTFNARISALCSAGKVLEASRIFRDMQIDEALGLPRPNVITYNLMFEGFCKQGMLVEAKALVESMEKNGDLMNLDSYNIWFLGLLRNSKLVEAQLVLKDMVDKCVEPNIYSYNIVMDGLCKNEMLSDARMVMGFIVRSGLSPDTVTYSTLLHGYCRKGKLSKANAILNEMIRNGCGKILEAEELLQKMNEKGYGVDAVTCNIVIDGLCKSGKLDKAMEIAHEVWTRGSAALGNLGNSFIGLVDNVSRSMRCIPDTGKIDEAKKKFREMMGSKNQIFEIYGLVDEMKERGIISNDTTSILDDMLQMGINSNISTFRMFVEAFCKGSDFGIAKELFEISLYM